MADNLTAEQRKKNMTAIKSRHTKPEIIAVFGTFTTANAETCYRKPTLNTGRTKDSATSKEIGQISKFIRKKAGKLSPFGNAR
jgi:hypothetical protein